MVGGTGFQGFKQTDESTRDIQSTTTSNVEENQSDKKVSDSSPESPSLSNCRQHL